MLIDEKELALELGALLKKRREELGYTLQYVADYFDTQRTVIHKYETGIVNIPFVKLVSLCKILKTTVPDLIEKSDYLNNYYRSAK